MRIELKGLLIALTTALAVLAATFGISALMRHGQNESTPSRSASAKTAASAPAGGAALIAQGHQFYTQSCASCHGPDAKGGYGPSLHHEDMSDQEIVRIIKNGVKGRMPAFAAKYDAAQTQALVVYIRTLK